MYIKGERKYITEKKNFLRLICKTSLSKRFFPNINFLYLLTHSSISPTQMQHDVFSCFVFVALLLCCYFPFSFSLLLFFIYEKKINNNNKKHTIFLLGVRFVWVFVCEIYRIHTTREQRNEIPSINSISRDIADSKIENLLQWRESREILAGLVRGPSNLFWKLLRMTKFI